MKDRVGAGDRIFDADRRLAEADLAGALQRLCIAIEQHDLSRSALLQRGARDGAADQANADDGDLVEHRSHYLPRNSFSSLSAASLPSTVPTEMRRWFGIL